MWGEGSDLAMPAMWSGKLRSLRQWPRKVTCRNAEPPAMSQL